MISIEHHKTSCPWVHVVLGSPRGSFFNNLVKNNGKAILTSSLAEEPTLMKDERLP